MTATHSAPTKSGSLTFFFALAFLVSWAAWIPTALGSYGLVRFQANPAQTGLVGAFGPVVAAVISIARYEGRAGFRELFKRLSTWRVGVRWYLFVLTWPAVLSLLKTGIVVALGNPSPDFSRPPFVDLYPLPPGVLDGRPFILFLPLVFLQQLLVGSSMGEEPGWRGYALPRLQQNRSALRASLLLGALWSLWHLPLWLTKDHPMSKASLAWPILELVATTVLFTWVYNNTTGSLLLALLFHTSIAVTGLFLAPVEAHPWIGSALSWSLVALVTVTSGLRVTSSRSA